MPGCDRINTGADPICFRHRLLRAGLRFGVRGPDFCMLYSVFCLLAVFMVKAFPESEPVWTLPFLPLGVLAGQICRRR